MATRTVIATRGAHGSLTDVVRPSGRWRSAQQARIGTIPTFIWPKLARWIWTVNVKDLLCCYLGAVIEVKGTARLVGLRAARARGRVASSLVNPLARGVTVARLTLDQLVLVRIQAGQQGKTAG